MRLFILYFFSTMPLLAFGQGMKINWEDGDGREFSVHTHSGRFEFSALAGDEIAYNNGLWSDTGPEGTIKKIGPTTIEWNTGLWSDTGSAGTIKKIGPTTIEWNTGLWSDTGPAGTISKVGGLTINYNVGLWSDTGPVGSIKNTKGSVN